MNLSPYRAMGCDGPVTLFIQPVAKQTTSLSLYTACGQTDYEPVTLY
jgi:hypothetical protein